MLRREKNLCCHFARLANMRLEAYRMKFQSALVSNRHCECLITLVSYHSGGQGNSVGAELPAALETTRATKIHSCLAAHFRGRETTLECFRQIVFLPQTEACSFFSIDLLCVFTVRRISRLLCVFTVHSTVRLIIARLIIVRPLPHIIRHSEEVGIIIVLLIAQHLVLIVRPNPRSIWLRSTIKLIIAIIVAIDDARIARSFSWIVLAVM